MYGPAGFTLNAAGRDDKADDMGIACQSIHRREKKECICID
jgi:hypothetical protein